MIFEGRHAGQHGGPVLQSFPDAGRETSWTPRLLAPLDQLNPYFTISFIKPAGEDCKDNHIFLEIGFTRNLRQH